MFLELFPALVALCGFVAFFFATGHRSGGFAPAFAHEADIAVRANGLDDPRFDHH